MATAAPDRSRQYLQRRTNLHQGQIGNLDTRASAIEESVRALASRPGSKTVVKRLDGQFNPNFCFDELRETDNVTVIPVVTSLVENYPARKANTSYKLRHSVVANYADEPFEAQYHPRFVPIMGRTFSLKADGPVDWSQGLKDGYVQIGKQSLAFLGELKGPWQPATQYKFGDNVVVQARYAPFMGMPASQTQLFVFNCVRDHTSGDLMSYVGFWDLTNDYLDASGNPTVPTENVDFGTGNTHWRLVTYGSGAVRQFWPWNPATNSVQATLFTDQMDELRFPVHNNPGMNYLLDTTNSNVPHALYQEQGVIALADGRLTLWHSNWWKAQSATSGSGALTFPPRAGNKRHVIDGNILWRRTGDHGLRANILLPIDSRIKPFSRLTLLPYSVLEDESDVEMVNLTASHLYDTSPTSRDGPGAEESTLFIFDSIRGHWVREY